MKGMQAIPAFLSTRKKDVPVMLANKRITDEWIVAKSNCVGPKTTFSHSRIEVIENNRSDKKVLVKKGPPQRQTL